MPSRNPVDADGLLLVSEAAIPSTPPAPALTPPLSLPARSLAMASNAASFFTAQVRRPWAFPLPQGGGEG